MTCIPFYLKKQNKIKVQQLLTFHTRFNNYRTSFLKIFLAAKSHLPFLPVAQAFLQNTQWDLEDAVQQYMENPGRYVASSAGAGADFAYDVDDDVRQPIQPTRSTLVDPQEAVYLRAQPRGRPRSREASRSVFEAFRDLEAEARETVQSMRQTWFPSLKNIHTLLLGT